MKANELMIGDWVLFCDEPKRVRSIVVSDNGVERIYVFDKSCQVSTIEAYIQPIPLTPEILEKNGIVYDYDEEECVADYKFVKLKGYQYSDDEILIDYCNGHIKVISDFYGDVNMEIEYVHELQHALKLLKIEKTIEL